MLTCLYLNQFLGPWHNIIKINVWFVKHGLCSYDNVTFLSRLLGAWTITHTLFRSSCKPSIKKANNSWESCWSYPENCDLNFPTVRLNSTGDTHLNCPEYNTRIRIEKFSASTPENGNAKKNTFSWSLIWVQCNGRYLLILMACDAFHCQFQ